MVFVGGVGQGGQESGAPKCSMRSTMQFELAALFVVGGVVDDLLPAGEAGQFPVAGGPGVGQVDGGLAEGGQVAAAADQGDGAPLVEVVEELAEGFGVAAGQQRPGTVDGPDGGVDGGLSLEA